MFGSAGTSTRNWATWTEVGPSLRNWPDGGELSSGPFGASRRIATPIRPTWVDSDEGNTRQAISCPPPHGGERIGLAKMKPTNLACSSKPAAHTSATIGRYIPLCSAQLRRCRAKRCQRRSRTPWPSCNASRTIRPGPQSPSNKAGPSKARCSSLFLRFAVRMTRSQQAQAHMAAQAPNGVAIWPCNTRPCMAGALACQSEAHFVTIRAASCPRSAQEPAKGGGSAGKAHAGGDAQGGA